MIDRSAVIHDLEAACKDLLFISERDAPFALVDEPGAPFAALDGDQARKLAGRPATDQVETVSVSDFFRNAVQDQDWHGPAEKATVQRYRDLTSLIQSALPDAKVFRVGRRSIAVLIVGTGPGGGTLGLSTTVVET
ncbi:MAG TPA: nuclease A inhibitor family protein [Myxococcales bacterium]|jgi:hypothetical protein|nr:nuclease A inhibitor family protein [Myxococcales bacterium]